MKEKKNDGFTPAIDGEKAFLLSNLSLFLLRKDLAQIDVQNAYGAISCVKVAPNEATKKNPIGFCTDAVGYDDEEGDGDEDDDDFDDEDEGDDEEERRIIAHFVRWFE